MRPIKSVFSIAALTIMALFSSCSKGNSGTAAVNTNACSGTAYSFSADVQPIFASSCAISGCHNAGSTNSGGPLTNWTLIHAKATTIESQVNAGIMPQTGTLTADQKKKIICWVESGALNN